MQYIIDQDTVNAIVSYLQGKPYAEVAAGIETLKTLKPVPESEDPEALA